MVAVEIEDYIVQNLIILSETVVLTSFKCVSHLPAPQPPQDIFWRLDRLLWRLYSVDDGYRHFVGWLTPWFAGTGEITTPVPPNKNTELCCCCVNGMHEWDLLLRMSVWCCAYIDSAGTAREQAKTGRCQHTLFCNFLHSNYNKYTFNTAKCTTNWHKLKFWSTWWCAVYKLLCPN